DGYLTFEALVPPEINERGLEEMARLMTERVGDAGMKPPHTGTPLAACYPPPSAIGEFLRLPQVAGIIESLVGADPTFDHDWTHHIPAGSTSKQALHVDAITDSTDPTFDIQLFWFPHEVKEGEGGTRFVPGSHLRRVLASGLDRYQHIKGEKQAAGPAGTVLVFHHGMWHAGQPNPGSGDRWMHKTRLNPRVPQVRLWDTSDLAELQNPPSDHVFARMQPDSVAHTFRTWHPWMGITEYRNEQMERARLWRYLTGDDAYDVDHYLTRLEGRAEVARMRRVNRSCTSGPQGRALDSPTTGWAFHDGTAGAGPGLPEGRRRTAPARPASATAGCCSSRRSSSHRPREPSTATATSSTSSSSSAAGDLTAAKPVWKSDRRVEPPRNVDFHWQRPSDTPPPDRGAGHAVRRARLRGPRRPSRPDHGRRAARPARQIEAEADAALRALPDQRLFIAESDAITFVPHVVTRSAEARAVSRHPAIGAVGRDLLGPDVRLYWDQIVYKKPDKPREFPWHQDNGYTYVEPQQYLTVWLALTTPPSTTGALGCPGRHRRDARPRVHRTSRPPLLRPGRRCRGRSCAPVGPSCSPRSHPT
ncbi:MAG: phytanoyl-CoA dioxygenase family protein, partial [Acidimicrobiales bacterium]